ncbi:protein of unknown function DUF397 [Actinobacteria bacterium OV450]|uniref:DUF397 domain-containing protein n=1 Tax=Streptomyces sp. NPDC056387 TaxID=3345803 RepID=UPI0006BA8B88|nr:protein of unknown function DUF397 [Actinobacteria bacterium OV450]
MRADVDGLSWRTSSYSNGDGGDCVEVSDDLPGLVPVRDTKLAGAGPVLAFAAAAWSSFIQGVKSRG